MCILNEFYLEIFTSVFLMKFWVMAPTEIDFPGIAHVKEVLYALRKIHVYIYGTKFCLKCSLRTVVRGVCAQSHNCRVLLKIIYVKRRQMALYASCTKGFASKLCFKLSRWTQTITIHRKTISFTFKIIDGSY